jgi:hypothetical protein
MASRARVLLADRVADLVFDGWIAGLGTASGYRIVIGCWPTSPYGPVADVMLETVAGHRVLLAPSRELAAFIGATYAFDEVRVQPVTVDPVALVPAGRVRVAAGDLDLTFLVDGSTALGRLLRLVPHRLAGWRCWVALLDLPARVLAPGVRTVGSAGGGRREWYAARDNRGVRLLVARWEGHDLGGLADVDPPVRFGFGSTPRRPSWTRVTTTVRLPEPAG